MIELRLHNVCRSLDGLSIENFHTELACTCIPKPEGDLGIRDFLDAMYDPVRVLGVSVGFTGRGATHDDILALGADGVLERLALENALDL